MASDDQVDEDHTETVVVLARDGLQAAYVWKGVDSTGVELGRIVDGEEVHTETLTWNEVGRMLQSRAMRVYDMTPAEVAELE